jgi:hypothetical protein
MYVYHYQDSYDKLVFRYDNALHKPTLPFTEHKHLQNNIIYAVAPHFKDILEEIFTYKNWIKS